MTDLPAATHLSLDYDTADQAVATVIAGGRVFRVPVGHAQIDLLRLTAARIHIRMEIERGKREHQAEMTAKLDPDLVPVDPLPPD